MNMLTAAAVMSSQTCNTCCQKLSADDITPLIGVFMFLLAICVLVLYGVYKDLKDLKIGE